MNESNDPTREREGVRSAGILLHPTSLPGPFGIGDLGLESDRFLNWCAAAGQSLWQVLPLSPTGAGNSPYNAPSAFAGNPLLVSPELLVAEGFLPAAALAGAPGFPVGAVDFDAVRSWKARILRASWYSFERQASPAAREEWEAFRRAPERACWLPDWTLFSALKERHGGRSWTAWERELRLREPDALARTERELSAERAYHAYAQYLFFRQWARVRDTAHRRGIRVLGDVPIYVALDSADVWAHPEVFALDSEARPLEVAGVPPDYFSKTGQLWGNPLYRWDRLEQDGYSWWVERMRAAFSTYDLVRVDHFRGFAAYWSVPAGETTALSGRWRPGPGRKLFDAIRAALGDLAIIAEDLGDITEDVRRLRAELGFPGMKILQFAFAEPDHPYQPHRHEPGCVVYTGTHDNDTVQGWFSKAGAEERARAVEYLGADSFEIEWDLIRAAYSSVARMAIVPVQDVLGLSSKARMNTPSEPSQNWRWRLTGGELTPEAAARLRRLAVLTGRARAEGPTGGPG